MTDTQDNSAAIAEAIRDELALGGGIQRFTTGSVPVFAVGDRHVIKLFPLHERPFLDAECAVLECISGRLPIPTPRLVATGERGQWLYIVMTRLAGISLAEAWPSITVRNRLRLMREVGEALAALHAIPANELTPFVVDWPTFIATQRATCRERQLARGLGAPWLDQVDAFLARWAPLYTGPKVLLHTEIMREHLLAEQRDGEWRISGLVDFEPAMAGAPEYDLASIGIFVACAEPGLLGALLGAYGATVDSELPMRIMAYALLHRYSNLRWYLECLPIPEDVVDLESLARRWFTP